MRRDAIIASGALHVAVVALAFFGLPSLFRPAPIEDSGPIAVEVVTTNPTPSPPAPAPKPAPPKPKAPPPPPPEKTAPPPPPPPDPTPAPEPESVPVPAPKPKPKKVEVPKPKPEPAPVKQAKIPPRPKHKPKPPPPKETLTSLLKDIRKDLKPAPEKPARKPAKKPVSAKDLAKDLVADLKPQAAQRSQPAPSALSKFQASQLVGMVRNQISPCWSVPIGAKDARDMRIDIRIALNPDGTLRGVPSIEDQARMTSDPVFRAFAESALRAIQDPRCSPLHLPPERYSEWSDMIIAFNPKELAGP